jgi:hypothetical protein
VLGPRRGRAAIGSEPAAVNLHARVQLRCVPQLNADDLVALANGERFLDARTRDLTQEHFSYRVVVSVTASGVAPVASPAFYGSRALPRVAHEWPRSDAIAVAAPTPNARSGGAPRPRARNVGFR